MRKIVLSALLLAAAVTASLEIRAAAKEGIGLSPDSVLYIAAARNMAAGKGFSTPTAAGIDVPLTFVPPVYPLLLSFLVRLVPRHFFAAIGWLNAGLFGVLAAMIGAWVYRSSHASLWFTGIIFVFVLSQLDLLRVYTMLWSETSFLPLTFAALWFLEAYVHRPSPGRLIAAALFTAAAWFTRYAGVATVAAGGVGILCCQEGPFAKRIRGSVAFAAAAGLPMAVWLMRNFFLTRQATARPFAFHPLLGRLSQAVRGTLSLWFFQDFEPRPGAPIAGALILLAALGILYWVYRKKTLPPVHLRLLLIFSSCYLLLIIVISLFYEAQLLAPGEYDRILCPLHAALLLSGAAAFSNGDWPKWLGRVLGAAAAVLALYFGYNGVAAIKTLSQDGQQYAGRDWRSSETIRYIERLPTTLHVYTNGPKPVYLYADRSCYEIPPKILPGTELANPAYLTTMDRIHTEIVRGIAVAVYFEREQRPQFPSETELRDLWPVPTIRMEDGVIFAVRRH